MSETTSDNFIESMTFDFYYFKEEALERFVCDIMYKTEYNKYFYDYVCTVMFMKGVLIKDMNDFIAKLLELESVREMYGDDINKLQKIINDTLIMQEQVEVVNSYNMEKLVKTFYETISLFEDENESEHLSQFIDQVHSFVLHNFIYNRFQSTLNNW